MKTTKHLPVNTITREIAKQPNEFTRATFKGSALAYKLIIFALYKIAAQATPQEKEQKEMRCSFSSAEFLTKLGMSQGTRQTELVEKATEELSRSILILRSEDASRTMGVSNVKMPWFEDVTTMEDGSVRMRFNRSVARFFDYKMGYSAIELLEIGDLQSFYAMRYYALAKSNMGFRGARGNGMNAWWFEFTEDELRRYFGIEEGKYKDRKDFVKNAIKNPCEELNEKTGLKVDLQYEKISKGKYRWRFLCSTKSDPLTAIPDEPKAVRDDRRAADEERARVAMLRERHPERWAELLERERGRGPLNGMFAEITATASLLEEFRDER